MFVYKLRRTIQMKPNPYLKVKEKTSSTETTAKKSTGQRRHQRDRLFSEEINKTTASDYAPGQTEHTSNIQIQK